ncbi:glycosyltransferase family 2 protein, partial [Candidatus Microgenomates bacterium]|nr:glycosyltransferase family 2 protein [Candidatus Microgenomates bacterium]
MIKITVVISAYNEEKNIKECLESVRQLADEIILIDNTSTDKTVEIASSMGQKVKIFIRPNNLMLNINKNFGFSKAVNEWILNLDADERVSKSLKHEIIKTLKQKNRVIGYWTPRKNIIFGKWIKHGIWWPDHQLRLFKKNKGGFPCKHIHEYLKVEGKTARLE